MINTIIFDVDGTLFNETDVKVKAELLTAEYISNNSSVDVETIYNTFRRVKKQIISNLKGIPEANDRRKWYHETLKNLGIVNITESEASRYYWEIVYDKIVPYDDLLYVLPHLITKYKLYILTDELFDIHKIKLKKLGIEKAFIKTISSEQVGETKPSKKLFNYALNIIGELASNVLIVGDNPAADIRGGNSVGMHTAWLKRGKYFFYPRNGYDKPEIIFTNYIQLISKIESMESVTG